MSIDAITRVKRDLVIANRILAQQNVPCLSFIR